MILIHFNIKLQKNEITENTYLSEFDNIYNQITPEPTSSDYLITPQTLLGRIKRCSNYFVSKELKTLA